MAISPILFYREYCRNGSPRSGCVQRRFGCLQCAVKWTCWKLCTRMIQQPQNQSVAVAATATFTADATGTPTPTVQWQQSTNNGGSFQDIPSATTKTLSFVTALSQ